MSVSASNRRRSGKRGSGRVIVALAAVIAAIVLVGYFAFVHTGVPRHGAGDASPADASPLPSPSP